MAIEDIISGALQAVPGFTEGTQAPYVTDYLRQRAAGEGLRNQVLGSYLEDATRQREKQAAAPGALSRLYLAAAAQPGTISRPGAMDLGENPEAAGTPATVTPGRPAARTAYDLIGRGTEPEDLDLATKYRPEGVKALGLMTPEAQAAETTAQQGRELALSTAQRGANLTDQIQAALANGNVSRARILGAVLSASRGDIRDLDTILRTTGESGGAPQPEVMEISGERWVKKPNAQGLPVWQREQDPVMDWIAAHPKETSGLSSQAARDLARNEIAKRAVTTRIEVTQPSLSQDAVDRAADYLNTTGQLPAGLGFGNPKLRAQIMDRAAEKAKAVGGDLGLAAIKANYDANKSELTRLQTQRGPTMAFAETADRNLAMAVKLSAQVPRTEIPILNTWIQSGQRNWTGNPALAQFAGAVQTFINEYAKVTAGLTGQSTDASRAHAAAMLNTAQTPEAFIAVAKTLQQEMQNRGTGFDQMIAATQGRMKTLGAPETTAPAPAAPVRWGRDANGNPVRLP